MPGPDRTMLSEGYDVLTLPVGFYDTGTRKREDITDILTGQKRLNALIGEYVNIMPQDREDVLKLADSGYPVFRREDGAIVWRAWAVIREAASA